MDLLDRHYYRFKNELKRNYHSVKLLVDTQQKQYLKNNKPLKDAYKGRCFIVGNGPSLVNMDLTRLKDERVFTVNYFMKSPLYAELRNAFHVMMDPNIFDFRGEYGAEKISLFHMINKPKNKPICFFPIQARESIIQNHLDQELEIRYLHCNYNMYDNYKHEIDLTKICPGFANVTLYAAMIAIYLGFQEIIFIGCDMTGYEQLSVIAGKEVQLHAYKMDENEKKGIQATHAQILTEDFFLGFSNTFAQYRIMREYCEKKSIKLLNATAGGILNEIKRVDYLDLF